MLNNLYNILKDMKFNLHFCFSEFSDDDLTNSDSSDESVVDHDSRNIIQERILKKKISNFLKK